MKQASERPRASRFVSARDIGAILLLGIAYVVTGRIGLTLAYYQQHATLVWAPAGLSIAALWLRGPRMAPGVFLGALITNLAIGSSPWLAMAIAAGNTAESLVAWALVRRAGLGAGLRTVRDVVLFLGLIVLVATAVAALNGAGWLVALAGLPLHRAPITGLVWWLGDAGGVLIATPLLLSFLRPSAVRMGGRLRTEVVLLAIFAVISAAGAFAGLVPGHWVKTPIALLTFPALVWAALRFGMRGATVACAAMSIAAVAGTVAGTGPFHYGNVHVDVAMLWLFLATLSVSAMLLAVSLEERTREAIARKEGEHWLEIALGSADAVAFERDLVAGRVRAAERWIRDEDWEASIHPDDRPNVRAAVGACLRGERDTWDVEYRVIGEAAERWVLERARVVERGPDREARRAFGLRRDVTELRRAADELERTRRLGEIGMLAGGVAHDFNNLLAVIRVSVDVGRANRSTATTREAFEAIGEAAQRGAELTDQLLAYAGRRPMQRRDVDLGALVAHTVRMLSPTIAANVDVDVSTEAPLVEADPAQIRQVLMNLVINASESFPRERRGTIRVRVAPERGTDGERLVLEVEDDGEGMDRETTARLFEPFFTTKPHGRGLGMAAVLGIVRAHGGTIDVESERGRGTTFRVRFPATNRFPERTSPRALPVSAPAAKTGSRRVLVVDDEPGIRALTRTLLEDAGYTVRVAGNAEEALERFAEEGPFDVALLDLRMPGKTGAELLDALREKDPRLAAVLMSGYSEELLPGGPLSGTPFLAKPFREAELLARLDEAHAR